MLTLRFDFKDAAARTFTGTFSECAFQLANARLHPSFLGYEIVTR